jgi:hypothetical protein
MKRYFFDVALQSSIQYDFRGRQIDQIEQVRETAELIALDIECTNADEPAVLEVQVRDIVGKKLFSVPVRSPELIAA